MSARILVGDCLVRMKELPDNSVDSVVCDPPYHLTSIVKRFGSPTAAPAKVGQTGAYARHSTGFMGQKWDGGDIAQDPAMWAEVLRVLKPGGHLVAFSGTRTSHRMVCAIEDAGFEIRDSILDLIASDDPVRQFLASLSLAQIEAFFRCIEDSRFGGMLAWVFGAGFPKSLDVSKAIEAKLTTGGSGPKNIRQRDMGDGYRPHELAGTPNYGDGRMSRGADADRDYTKAPPLTTPEAQQWRGFGTALKPAHEPICLARKPLAGTVAQTVLRHGTGALNIDACRIGTDGGTSRSHQAEFERTPDGKEDRSQHWARTGHDIVELGKGRWPANLCLSYPEDEYQLKATATAEQRRELFGWLHANA